VRGAARKQLSSVINARFIHVFMPIVDRSNAESRRKYAIGADAYYLKLNDMPGRLIFEVGPPFGREKVASGCLIAGLVVQIEVRFLHFFDVEHAALAQRPGGNRPNRC
jgi:hypothetical protein